MVTLPAGILKCLFRLRMHVAGGHILFFTTPPNQIEHECLRQKACLGVHAITVYYLADIFSCKPVGRALEVSK